MHGKLVVHKTQYLVTLTKIYNLGDLGKSTGRKLVGLVLWQAFVKTVMNCWEP
jgi:hypothetical protein